MKNILKLFIFSFILVLIYQAVLYTVTQSVQKKWNTQTLTHNYRITGKFSIKHFATRAINKIISRQYFTFEPYILRGRWVDNFYYQCHKTECLPFQKAKIRDETLFLKKLKNFKLDEKKIIMFPIELDENFKEIIFYTKLPIYFSHVGLGQIYYLNKTERMKIIDRYRNSFLFDECYGLFKNKIFGQSANYNHLFNNILIRNKIYGEEELNCKNYSLQELVIELKRQKVGYLIEHDDFEFLTRKIKNQKVLDSTIVKKEFCIKKICLYKFL